MTIRFQCNGGNSNEETRYHLNETKGFLDPILVQTSVNF